jgi:hypothetical protein
MRFHIQLFVGYLASSSLQVRLAYLSTLFVPEWKYVRTDFEIIVSFPTFVTVSTAMWVLLVVLLISYLLAVQFRRFQRLSRMHASYIVHFHNMTPRMAQKICHECLFYETPTTMLLGTQVALFKVYGIVRCASTEHSRNGLVNHPYYALLKPSIASILGSTGQLKSSRSLTKRLADVSTEQIKFYCSSFLKYRQPFLYRRGFPTPF